MADGAQDALRAVRDLTPQRLPVRPRQERRLLLRETPQRRHAMKDPTPCDSCAATGTTALIHFVRVHSEHGLSWMPVNAEPDPEGNVAYSDGTARVLADDQRPAPYEVLYMPHFATCVAPEAHRRPAHRQRRHEARRVAEKRGRAQPGAQTLFGGEG